MKKARKEKHFIKNPAYPGGQKALNAFVKANLKYPAEARAEGIEGSVYLRYSINPKGKVVDTKIISSLGYGCDEEAVRVVKLLQFDAEKVFRSRVLYHKKIRVWFKQPKAKKTTINYQLTASPKTNSPEAVPAKKKSGYQITIKLK